jgi:hypothetical protein
MSSKAFFSFTEVTDPARQADYNAWHQLDHRPENLALSGVHYGERWVLSPDCAESASALNEPLDRIHYVNMYWFAEPVEPSFREWQALAERSFQWGRRDDVHFSRRALMGTFTPVKGYVNQRVLVSADALPFRPNRGVEVTVTHYPDPHSAAAERLFAEYDRVRIPELLACAGAAGAWVFSSQSTTMDTGWNAAPGTTTFDQDARNEAGQVRITLVYLDEDPLVYQADRERRSASSVGRASPGGPGEPGDPIETTVFRAVLRNIEPWKWDWFDQP